jgi:hypothetical protein
MRALWGRHGYDAWDFAHDVKGQPVDDGLFRVYGHTRVKEAVVTDAYANIDTGAAYGGSLSAFIWPSREIVSQVAID